MTGQVRIIPARAGFTHEQVAVLAQDGGSSPLARGLQESGGGRRHQGRIIPARAGFTRGVRRPADGRRDHPRSRGVYWGSCAPSRMGDGSSPLARGLPQGWDGDVHVRGIIPARAGFTGAHPPGPRGAEDHPRSRGVYYLLSIEGKCSIGSSPLARGLLARARMTARILGIIPARAGFTAPATAPPATPLDHPRSRGVYHSHANTSSAVVGSSPLARGLRPQSNIVNVA